MAYFSSSLPCQPPCSGKFACLRSRLGLATRKGSTVEVARARCHYCSSKLCLSFGAFEHKDLYSKGGARATITIWDSRQLAGSKMVLSRDRVEQKKGEAAKLQVATIVDLTLHGQLHIFRFRPVANLLALRAALMPLVRVPWCHNCSSKLCLQLGTCETRSPQLVQLCQNYKFGPASFQLPSSTTSTTATK